MTCSAAGLLTLNTAAVVGMVIALLVFITTAYSCGLLTGLLMLRRKNNIPSASGALSAPMYEQVLPPTCTSFSLRRMKLMDSSTAMIIVIKFLEVYIRLKHL